MNKKTVTQKNLVEIDLLDGTGVYKRWRPQILRHQYNWKVFSGKWKFELPARILFQKEPGVSNSENASVLRSSVWDEYDFNVTFKMQSDTIRPPEGGVILFFLFKNIRNHYSFHFCMYKQKIELIKRLHGVWTTLAEQDYNFVMEKEYRATVSTSSGVHQCYIDGVNQIEIFDRDISRGFVGIGAKYCDTEFTHISVSVPVTVLR